MLINAHCHVFTFRTFLTGEAENNLRERIKASHLSEALANDLLRFAKEALFGGDPDSLATRLYAYLQQRGIGGQSLYEFFRRGCLGSVSEVTDALVRDTEAHAAPGEDVVVVPLMMDVIDTLSPAADKALYAEQYRQTVLQAVRHPGHVLPFVCVNPLRGPEAFDRMLQALETGECVGVKLYPSLGYTVNDKMMDRVMQACEGFDAPVIMHCNDGGFCGSDYDYTYCSPVSWRDMIVRYNVRFDFAHFGDQTPAKVSYGSPTLWRDTITSLMPIYPGRVYADVSYQSGPIGGPGGQYRYTAWLKDQLASSRGDQILWGTDSFMLFLSVFEKDYWQFFRDALGADFARIAEKNPRKFLGLPEDGAKPLPGSAMERHIDFLKSRKAAGDSQFGEGSAPAAWLVDRL